MDKVRPGPVFKFNTSDHVAHMFKFNFFKLHYIYLEIINVNKNLNLIIQINKYVDMNIVCTCSCVIYELHMKLQGSTGFPSLQQVLIARHFYIYLQLFYYYFASILN